MTLRAITFDAAETLLRVRWSPGEFAVDCALECGLDLSPTASAAFSAMLRSRWSAYREINLRRDPAEGDRFWDCLTSDWLRELGEAADMAPEMMKWGRAKLYETRDYFDLYEDAIPTLERFENLGVQVAIISNWDYSLHRILRSLGIHDRFEVVTASLEEGVEKPAPELFHLTLAKLGVTPELAAHIGDNPIDDLAGARVAGMQGLLIDRSRKDAELPYIASLTQAPEVLGWPD